MQFFVCLSKFGLVDVEDPRNQYSRFHSFILLHPDILEIQVALSIQPGFAQWFRSDPHILLPMLVDLVAVDYTNDITTMTHLARGYKGLSWSQLGL